MFGKPENHQGVQVQSQRHGSLHRLRRSILRVVKSQELLGSVKADLQRPTHGKQFQDGLGRHAQVGAEEAVILWPARRITHHHTRALLNAALDGRLSEVKYRQDRLFNFEVPTSCPDVPEEVLDPANTWGNKDDYWRTYDGLAARYIENFKLFARGCPEEVVAAGPKRLSQVQ